MMRIREGSLLRNSERIRLENAVTTVTESAITKAGCNLAVTASAEADTQYLNRDGLLDPNGLVSNFIFLAENIGSFSYYSWLNFLSPFSPLQYENRKRSCLYLTPFLTRNGS